MLVACMHQANIIYSLNKSAYNFPQEMKHEALDISLHGLSEVLRFFEAGTIYRSFIHHLRFFERSAWSCSLVPKSWSFVSYPPHAIQVIEWTVGDAFDFAMVLCSFLLGAGYDAYVVYGTAPR